MSCQRRSMNCGSRPIRRARALLQHVLRPAFADTRDACVGLHRDHHVALVEQRVGIGRRYARTRVIFIFGIEAKAGRLPAAAESAVAERD